MWVDVILKAPDQGQRIALTFITSSGDTEIIGYFDAPEPELTTLIDQLQAITHLLTEFKKNY